MRINKIEVDESRDIVIIDEAFKAGEHQALYDTCMTLKYSCANSSNFDIQDVADRRLKADLPQLNEYKLMDNGAEGTRYRRSLCPVCGSDFHKKYGDLGKIPEDNICTAIFGSSLRMENFSQLINPEKYEFSNAYVNMGLVNDSHEIHVDAPSKGQGITMLIYPNIEWGANHGGETVFYEEDKREMVYLNPYVPGRICIFDGSIPHCAKPQALVGPKYRFTIACKFTRVKEEDGDLLMMDRDSQVPANPTEVEGDIEF
tara:strand:- start:95 stop:868 length:774 start_codon:yes stop_codon:yes gene_type:complete